MGLSTVCRMAIFLQESLSTGQAHGLLELTSRNVGILEPRRPYTASFDIRNRRASTRITSGRRTASRRRETGTAFRDRNQADVGRGDRSRIARRRVDQGHLAEDGVGIERFEHAIA
jgi:hypothetical protein